MASSFPLSLLKILWSWIPQGDVQLSRCRSYDSFSQTATGYDSSINSGCGIARSLIIRDTHQILLQKESLCTGSPNKNKGSWIFFTWKSSKPSPWPGPSNGSTSAKKTSWRDLPVRTPAPVPIARRAITNSHVWPKLLQSHGWSPAYRWRQMIYSYLVISPSGNLFLLSGWDAICCQPADNHPQAHNIVICGVLASIYCLQLLPCSGQSPFGWSFPGINVQLILWRSIKEYCRLTPLPSFLFILWYAGTQPVPFICSDFLQKPYKR